MLISNQNSVQKVLLPLVMRLKMCVGLAAIYLRCAGHLMDEVGHAIAPAGLKMCRSGAILFSKFTRALTFCLYYFLNEFKKKTSTSTTATPTTLVI